MKELMAVAKRRMEGALKSLEAEFASVRTGRASTHLLDRVTVPAYGSDMPLNQVAGARLCTPPTIAWFCRFPNEVT